MNVNVVILVLQIPMLIATVTFLVLTELQNRELKAIQKRRALRESEEDEP